MVFFDYFGSGVSLQNGSGQTVSQKDRKEAMRESLAQGEPLSICYDELHRIAAMMFRGERQGHTLQTTAIVNEAYLRLFNEPGARFKDKKEFLRIAATAMRHVLIDHARQVSAKKRGGGKKPIHLPTHCPLGDDPSSGIVDVLDLDEALKKLESCNKKHAEVVSLRIFAGLGIEETATTMGLSHTTVENDWRFALAWLRRELHDRHY